MTLRKPAQSLSEAGFRAARLARAGQARRGRRARPTRTAADFWRDRGGTTLVELSFILPVMLAVAVGAVDTTRYILLHQKVDKAAATVVDLATRPKSISRKDVNTIFTAARDVLTPFDLANRGRVIVSSVSKPSGGSAAIDWQHAGGGGYAATSGVGSAGGSPSLPTGFSVADGENLIVAEVFFQFEPLFLDYVIGRRTLSHSAIRKPRNGSLSTLDP